MNESFHLLVWLLQLYIDNILWVSDCCLTPTQECVSCIMVNKLIFHERMMRSTLYLFDTLSWMFIVITHWNNSSRIDISYISNILSWFRANQSLLFLLNAACLVARDTNFSLWFDLIGTRTHDLSHSRRARQPLLHRCDFRFNCNNE